jgi:hypothetical protein
MFAHISRREKLIFPILGILMPGNQEEILERPKLRK